MEIRITLMLYSFDSIHISIEFIGTLHFLVINVALSVTRGRRRQSRGMCIVVLDIIKRFLKSCPRRVITRNGKTYAYIIFI